MTREAVFYLAVDGQDVTANFDPVLISLTITDADGNKADRLEAVLDDADGQLELPRVGAKVSAGLGWSDAGATVMFEGVVDEPTSTGGRGQGRLLTLTAKSADLRGRLKSTKHKHKSKATFRQAAESFAAGTGVTVKVDPALAEISRDYWHMAHESFPAWGARVARELGATFKILGDQAVFVPRSSGKSVSGKALATITARVGDNVEHWSLSPTLGRPEYRKFSVRWYDRKAAKWRSEEVEAAAEGAGVDGALADRFARSAPDHSKSRAGSNKAESARDKGGGSITIDGDPQAAAEAICVVAGARPGIDGAYRIETATHRLTRPGGYLTELSLKQPAGKAGQDARNSKASAADAAAGDEAAGAASGGYAGA